MPAVTVLALAAADAAKIEPQGHVSRLPVATGHRLAHSVAQITAVERVRMGHNHAVGPRLPPQQALDYLSL